MKIYRACPYCDIDFDRSKRELDPTEPYRLAEAVYRMNLKHVVITSVNRDDLEDGGASTFNFTSWHFFTTKIWLNR